MRSARGVTLVEVVITVALVAILAALAYSSLARQKPRATLAGAAVELEAVLRNARQNAVSTGRDTVVMVFPVVANSAGGQGRVVVVEDRSPAGTTFFSDTAPINFAGFTAGRAVNLDAVLGGYDLPRGVTIGLGGASAPTLDEPYRTLLLTTTVGACSFCSTSDPDRRGAIVFDARGRARFHDANGGALDIFGGTIALNAAPAIQGYRLLVITGSTGGVRVFNNG